MAVDWRLGVPTVDVGAQFQQGLEHGREQRRQNALLEAQRGLFANPDDPNALAAYGQVDPAAAMQYRTQRADQVRTEQQRVTDQHREQIRLGARIVRQINPTDQAGWDRARAAAQSLGVPLDEVPAQFDPNYVQQLLAAGQALDTPDRPQQPYRWRANSGDLMEVGPDGQPRTVYDDPTDRIQWVRADNGDGTFTMVPYGPNGPVRGAQSQQDEPPPTQPGEVRNGYRYRGGALGDPNSWEPVQGGPQASSSAGGFPGQW